VLDFVRCGSAVGRLQAALHRQGMQKS